MMQDVYGFPVDVLCYQDLRFITQYGLPFRVWTQPQAGVLCLGVEGPRYGRLLIRFAGIALTGGLAPEIAVSGLRQAMPLYERLYPHPALMKLQGHGPAAGGYAAIFRWPEGAPLNDENAQRTLQRQPLLTGLTMFDALLDFHLFALNQGFVPVNLHDGSLIADFSAGKLTVVNIDLYRPLPAVNDRGRMPGASRYMSPEDFTLGAPLDGISAQYNLAALAFLFFGSYGSRERAAWMAGDPLYRVAERACREPREARWPSLEAFVAAWREAAGKTM